MKREGSEGKGEREREGEKPAKKGVFSGSGHLDLLVNALSKI